MGVEAGSQTQYAVGLVDYLGGKQRGRGGADGFRVLVYSYVHACHSLP